MDYTITINGADYSSYLQLPLQIQETLDETMDIANVTLDFMALRTPFKPYSIAVIDITQDGNTPLQYTMLVESDRVEEVQNGTDSFYTHNVTLIELTQLLANYYLSDFTITQPITAFAYPKATPTITTGSYEDVVFDFGWTVGRVFYENKLAFTDTVYSIKTKYTAPINLSNTILKNYVIKFIGNGAVISTYDTGNVSYTYYYKLHSASTWTAIPSMTSWSPAVGTYDIKAVMDTDFTYHYNYTSSSPSAYVINWEDKTGNASDISGLSEEVLFENIEVVTSTGEEDIYSIKEGIEKVLSVAKLEEIGQDYDFITLNSNTATKYDLENLKCPEMTITNGKNLLEVLYSIGREFNAYPRLIMDGDDYELTFDVLENPEDNSTYEDGTELETQEANMTNYANVLVSNVTNMTSSERTKIYPARNRWISCRTDPNEITLGNENMSILLDDNINYLVKVKVKNWLTSDLTNTQDITGYIFEKTNYDALNNSQTGKGLALYYEKGNRIIKGLGMLPELHSLIGLASTDYVIQCILNDLTSVNIADMESPLNYMYQVEYVPYVDAKINTHQSNSTDFDVDYQANYNQETANINAEAFGKGTQKVIGRIGNNNINKLVQVDNISEIPYLGENKTIGSDYYYANIVNTTFDNNLITVALEYSKDYNKINNRVGIDKEYREYSLYADSFVNRTINIEDYCLISTYSEAVTPNYFYYGLSRMAGAYYNLLSSGTQKTTFDGFKMAMYKDDGTTKLQYTPFQGSLTNLNEYIIPASCNVVGNAVNFVGNCYDNYSVNQYIGASAYGKYANLDARYVDDTGECPVIKLSLGYTDNYFDDTLADAKTFPIVTDTTEPLINYGFIGRKFRINKDNRERIKINYALNWFTKQSNITIHAGANKYLFSSTSSSTFTDNIALIGYTGDVKNKNIISYTTNDILNEVGDMTFDFPYSPCFYIKTSAVTPSKNYDGVALIWKNTGEILYSFKGATSGNIPAFYIYFNFINKKIDGTAPVSV